MTSEKNSASKKTPDFKASGLPIYLQELLAAGGEIYEVGGPVRDRLLDRPHKDHDLLIRKLPLEKIQKTLKKFGDVFVVGRAFGILKFYPTAATDIEYDIALPRTERSTGTQHRDFEITFDPELPIEEDLQRRDFTINAMAMGYETGRLIDPYGGQKDLQEKILRQVSPQSFEEDPLRLLRAVQFTARLHLQIEPETWKAMQRHAALIETVSAERVTEEIGKLLTAPKPSIGFCIMRDTGLLPYIFPELQKTVGVEQGRKFRNDDVFMHTMRVLDASRKDDAIPYAGDMELMLAALFHDVGKPQTKRYNKEKDRLTFYGHQTISKRLAKKRMKDLKMTTLGINPQRISTLVENHMFQAKSFFSDKAIRRFIRIIGSDLILKLVDLRIADNRGGKYPEGIRGVQKLRRRIEETLAQEPPFNVGDLVISGHDLIELGIPEGPMIGEILNNLVEVVLDYPEKNNRETLTKIITEDFGHAPQTSHQENKEKDKKVS